MAVLERQETLRKEAYNFPQVMGKANDEWWEYRMANQTFRVEYPSCSTATEPKEENWSHHQADTFLEVASAVHSKSSCFGFGVLGSNRNGKVPKAWVERNEGFIDPSLIKAVAIRNALIKARSVGWNRVSMGSSNKRIIHKLQKRMLKMSDLQQC
ncbi:hypothetical protein ACH5RR_004668 [Cinchona calisaya]|uniref:RNase H type-1 domain-containing protein n=1 Tax=Cinchona calisaya TaxID=153742 RepID=A0ABD3AY87_9GENT